MLLTICIVLYKNEPEILKKAILSVLNSNTVFEIKLFLVDNSPTDELKNLIIHDKIIYIHNPSNPGFGAAHNIAIKKSIEYNCQYHFIVNPDIFFNNDVLATMVTYMKENKNIGMMMPQILNFDGSIQFLPKLLPTPLSIIFRKLKFLKSFYNSFINRYELRFVPLTKIYNTPILSGCFTLLNLEAIKKIGMYDDRFFMYFEDWDLSRRMHQKYETIYFPLASVFHGYHSGANKNFKLFIIYIKSAISYFNKWGWFFDADRKKINKKTLSQF